MSCTSSPRVYVDNVNGITVITLAVARIIAEDILAELSEQLDLINGPELSRVVINFGEVKIMSSELLAALLRLSRRIASAEGRLKLCCLAPELMTIFRISSFDKYFEIRADERSALDSF